MSRTYVALDPGRTTGVCVWSNRMKGVQLRHHEYEDGLVKLISRLGYLNPDAVIFETFQYRRVPNADLYPVEIVGALRLWSAHTGVPLFGQSPSAKTLWDNGKLKAAGLYLRGQPHANDATRHLLYWASMPKYCCSATLRKWALEMLRHVQESQSSKPASDPPEQSC